MRVGLRLGVGAEPGVLDDGLLNAKTVACYWQDVRKYPRTGTVPFRQQAVFSTLSLSRIRLLKTASYSFVQDRPS